ncbi:hypothetical protein [Nocardioides acrostichi]|uniref:Uncharacterized protein n=1 Tax=Nocardioides acrostichi TaxID=2784339 RepID=A0A930UX23_9ACTN|nr:hypothetical protein [Nocardioides acrostichi]MBF4161262.1 hypothetical protein [Nocardioides acrostichi]
MSPVVFLGERSPIAEPRRLEIGLPGLLALAHRTDDALPAELRPTSWNEAESGAGIAGRDLADLLAEGEEALRSRGALDADGAVVPSIAADLVELAGNPRRVRLSLAGRGEALLAYLWAGADLAGSLVRHGSRCTLSLLDTRALGDEVATLLPDPVPVADRQPLAVPLETLSVVAADGEAAVPFGEARDLSSEVLQRLRRWDSSVQAVLHVAISSDDGVGVPRALVAFLAADGWWAATPTTAPAGADGEQWVRLQPTDRSGVLADVASLMTEAWT